MKALKITGKTFKWLKTILKKRQQRVKLSSFIRLGMGVIGCSQGSVLGPLLFVILMTDIDTNTQNANLGSFADDTRIWQSLNTTHPNIYKLH